MSQRGANNIRFFFMGVRITLNHRSNLKKFISGIFKKENKTLVGLNYIFCSDGFLQSLNNSFLNHDDYTDILTFSYSGCNTIEAEIYISIDRVKENARKFNTSIKEELHRVMFHGVLHLCGYNDKTKYEKKQMRAKENFYVKSYFT